MTVSRRAKRSFIHKGRIEPASRPLANFFCNTYFANEDGGDQQVSALIDKDRRSNIIESAEVGDLRVW
jgi:hypothetical protein